MCMTVYNRGIRGWYITSFSMVALTFQVQTLLREAHFIATQKYFNDFYMNIPKDRVH